MSETALRNTGRTQRMLEDVVREVRRGTALIVVVGHSLDACEILLNRMENLLRSVGFWTFRIGRVNFVLGCNGCRILFETPEAYEWHKHGRRAAEYWDHAAKGEL